MHSFVAALKPLNRAGRPLTSRAPSHILPGHEGRSAAILLVCLLFLAGCSEGGNNVAGPTTTSTAAPRPAPTTAAAQDPVAADIVGRYKQFWEVRFEANRPPVNPSDPRLGQLATGQQLENVRLETEERRDQGLALRRPETSLYERRVKLINLEGDTAELQDCVTNDGIVYRVATGEVVDSSVVTRSLSATMRLVDGAWKLADTRVLQEWEGVAGCAQSSDFS